MYTNNPHLVELEDMIEVRAMQFAKVAGEHLLSLTIKLRDDLTDAEQDVHGLLLTDGVLPKVFMPVAQTAQEVTREEASIPAEEQRLEQPTEQTPAPDGTPPADTTPSKAKNGNKVVPLSE